MTMMDPEGAGHPPARNTWLKIGNAVPPSCLTEALLSLLKPLDTWPAAMMETGGLCQLVFEGDALLLHLLEVLPPCSLRYEEQGQAQFQPDCWGSSDGNSIAPLVLGQTCSNGCRSGTYLMWWTCVEGLTVRIQVWAGLCPASLEGSSTLVTNRDPYLADLNSPVHYWPSERTVADLARLFIGLLPVPDAGGRDCAAISGSESVAGHASATGPRFVNLRYRALQEAA